MDLPLATPELDHDALRFNLLLPTQQNSRKKVTILLLIQTKVEDEIYSPSPVFRTPCGSRVLRFSSMILVAHAPFLYPSHTYFLSLLYKIACGANSPISGQV
jgi:hypothetical protein